MSVELARWVCLAARVEPALLRSARLRHMPSASASVEADLWFGPLVQTRGSQAIVFYQEVSARLRRELVSGTDISRPDHPDPGVRQRTARLLAARDLVRVVHRHPLRSTERKPYNLLQLEEELTWLSLVRSGDELEREMDTLFRQIIKAIVAEGREGIGRWALSVLPRLPAEARTRTARLLLAISESRIYGGWMSLDPASGEELSEEERNLLLKAMGRVTVGVRLSGHSLEFSTPPAEGSQKIEVPSTHPLSLDLSWEDDATRREQRIEWEVGTSAFQTGVAAPLSITTRTGDTYFISRQEEIVESLRRRLKSSAVCILDAKGLPTGTGLLVERTSVLVARQILTAASAGRADAAGRAELLMQFPLLDGLADYRVRGTPDLDSVNSQVGEGMRVELSSSPPKDVVPPAFGPAAEAVGKSCAALCFTPQKLDGAWLRLEVQEALGDGTYGVNLTTEVSAARLKFWAGAPVVNTGDGRIIGALHFRPSQDKSGELSPYLMPTELLGVFEHEVPSALPLRVFVSSTWEDLRPEREAVEAALQRMRGPGFVGMEYFGSRDDDTHAVLLAEVDRCHVYVGIFAARYGSGITEAEYRRARERGIPCLIYFKAESSITYDLVESDPAQVERLDRLKAELKRDHTVTEFKNPDALATQVTTDLHRFVTDNPTRSPEPTAPAQPTFSPTLAALHQLPPPPRDFTGRVAELEELTRGIGERGVQISGLHGQGGIGKTALALVLAGRLKPQYPDAQFYLDLRGASDQQPLSPADAMAHVVRAYHPTAKLPDDEAQLSALYHSVLEGKRALLLMDNARDAAQVEPLIPPDGCLLLVTSRRRFPFPGLHAKDLDTLSPEEARALLLSIAPRIASHADEIARLCGYLPLALRLAASALAERRDISPADYARRLSDSRQRLQLVEASIKLSYDQLSAELQRRWRTLSVAPTTFDAATAAAVWEIDSDAAQDVLGELIKYSMLEWDDKIARYSQHDLMRLFAAARLEEEEGHAAQTRQAKHYLDILQKAERLYLRGGEDLHAGLQLFDAESLNIHEGQAWAAAHADELTRSALCSDYALAAPHLLDLRLMPRERISWLEAGLHAARRSGNRVAETAHLANLGVAYQRLGEMRRAVELLEQSLVISREVGDRRGEGFALGNLGVAYASIGEKQRAIEFYEQVLALNREIGDRRSEGFALANLSAAYQDVGETRRAVELAEQALAINREIGDRRGEGVTLGYLGNAYTALGEPRRAAQLHEQALEISREIGDRRGEGNGLWNISVSLNELGDLNRAVEYAEAALKIFEQIEDPSAAMVRKVLADWRGQTK